MAGRASSLDRLGDCNRQVGGGGEGRHGGQKPTIKQNGNLYELFESTSSL